MKADVLQSVVAWFFTFGLHQLIYDGRSAGDNCGTYSFGGLDNCQPQR